MTDKDDWFEKCRTCQHYYYKKDDDYYYCRKRNGKCEYKSFLAKKEKAGGKND